MKTDYEEERSLFLFPSILIVLFFITITIIIVTIINGPTQIALAHFSYEFGNITVQTGWDQEPPLVDEMNDIIVSITRKSDLGNGSNNAIPVRNALADMNIMVKYGGVTKSLDFVPSQEQAGLYEAKILPTRIGSYNLVLNGTIQGQSIINDAAEIEDVESKQKVSFPETSGGSGSEGSGGSSIGATSTTSTNPLSGQLSRILNQITNDINNIKDDIETLAEGNSNIQEGMQNIRDIAERSYMLATTAIGIGAAGILIAAAALVRTR